MGKYNFTSEKFANIERRLTELEQENARLKELLETSIEELNKIETRPVRNISKDINNFDKAKELFSIWVKNNKIVKDETYLKNNFQTFYQNIFRAIYPYPCEDNKRQKIRYTPVNELSDEKYDIYIETLEAVIDVVYYANKKIKEEK